MNQERKTNLRVWWHTVMTAVWAANIPIAILTRWIYSVAYIAVCSIYANMVGHWSGREAALTDKHTPDKE